MKENIYTYMFIRHIKIYKYYKGRESCKVKLKHYISKTNTKKEQKILLWKEKTIHCVTCAMARCFTPYPLNSTHTTWGSLSS